MPSSSNSPLRLLQWIVICVIVISGVQFKIHRNAQTFAQGNTPKNNIPMRQGSPFKIALFADLHFGEDAWMDWGPIQDVNSVKVMSTVLDKEKPGLCDLQQRNCIRCPTVTSSSCIGLEDVYF